MLDAGRIIRKKNGGLAFTAQELRAIAENPVGLSLNEQPAKLILLPNPRPRPMIVPKDSA